MDLDEPTLTAIAEQTGGQYFRARNFQELEAIEESLDRLEPVTQRASQARPAYSLYSWPLALAVLLSIGLVCRVLWPHALQQRPQWLRRRA
ncbi:hypothetical protein D3C80_1444790 [compost metagenome]